MVILAACELTGREGASILEFDEPNKSLRLPAAPLADWKTVRGRRILDVKMDTRHYGGVHFTLGV